MHDSDVVGSAFVHRVVGLEDVGRVGELGATYGLTKWHSMLFGSRCTKHCIRTTVFTW